MPIQSYRSCFAATVMLLLGVALLAISHPQTAAAAGPEVCTVASVPGASFEYHMFCDGPNDKEPNYIKLMLSFPGPSMGTPSSPGGLRWFVWARDGNTSTPIAWAWQISYDRTRWELLNGGVRCWDASSPAGYSVEVDAALCS
jgi:hypothetical protein